MNQPFGFEISAQSGELARAGVIRTPHGQIATPAFVVVGTHGSVKCLSMAELAATGASVMLSNGYHLLRRAVTIDAGGGLAQWNGWRGPTMTDSGGFQIMSLGSGLGKIVSMDKKDIAVAERAARKTERLALVDDDGVEFRDPYHGRIVKFTPEKSIQTQHQIGADIMMAFDELTNIGDSYDYNVAALERTRVWAERSLREHQRLTNQRANKPYQALYGVLQGAHYEDLRKKAAHDLAAMTVAGTEFDGFGLGGAFEKERLGQILSWMTQILPAEKPRHLLGLGRPDDIFTGVENGCDTFDCVAPTREARHGRVYTLDGNINLRRAEFATDERPLDSECDCPVCHSGQARASLRARLKSAEPDERAGVLAALSQHNVQFIIRLTEQIRAALMDGTFDRFRTAWLDRYN